MKKITFLAIVVAIMGFYIFPVFLAEADSITTTTASGGQNLSTLTSNVTLYLRITAYSSDVDETDDTPFITANGTYVHDGIVATNLLPFGTKVQIPALFGNKIFTVADRMNPKMTGRMDIWMSSKAKALLFGSNGAKVVVLGNETSSQVIAEAGK